MTIHLRTIATTAALVALIIVTVASAQQSPPPSRAQEIQRLVNEHARLSAENVSDRARATTVGALNPNASLQVHLWNSAITMWKKSEESSAAALLAEGVLMDCLGRMQGVRTPMVSSEVPMPPPFANLVAQRPGRAAKLFDQALKRDPTLVEARFRAARIRASDSPAARHELELLAADEHAVPFNYLAAISRAEAARANHDPEDAIAWYDRALAIHPGSTAAAIAVGSLRATPIPFASLDDRDVYYTYPCTVLTEGVGDVLDSWIEKAMRR